MIKLIIKRILLTLGLIAVLPLMLANWLARLIFPLDWQKKVFIYSGEILSLCPTFVGLYLRKAFYWAMCTDVSPDVHFLFGSMLAFREVTIRQGCIIGHDSHISFADIGENVLFGARVSVISGKYQHGRPDQRTGEDELEEEHVVIKIGKNSWIGTNVTILADVGENCTVGAGSVVLKDVANDTTVLGNPARRVNLDYGKK